MLTIIFVWAILFFSISAAGRSLIKNVEWYEYFWVGLVATFAILQIWSIFLPVNIYSLALVIALGAVSAIIFRKQFKLPRLSLKHTIYIAMILLGVSYFASLPVGWEDTYLYHLNFVKWINSYPAVPGLANLHSRFGLNSSLFVFASMLDNWFLKDRSSHIALSLIATVLSLEFFWIFTKSKDETLKIFSLFALPLLAVNIVKRTMVASLSPDFALTLVVLAICVEFLKGTRGSLKIAGFLSMLLLTIKFSGALFAGLVLLAVIYIFWQKNRTDFTRLLLWLVFCGLVVVVPFIVRNVLLSGWPFYPLPFLGFNVSWALPRESVVGMYNVIQAWARQPGEAWSQYVGLSFWQWFPHWFTNNSGWLQIHMFFWGLILVFVAPLLKIVNKKEIGKLGNLVFLGAASLASVLYIIFGAPDLRFGEAFFWIFFVAVISYWAREYIGKYPSLRVLFLLIGVYLLFTFSWPVRVDSKPVWRSVRWETSFAVDKTAVKPTDGSPTFDVYKPEEHSLCGNSLLPCTPDKSVFDGKIKEIRPGDISKGFEPVR